MPMRWISHICPTFTSSDTAESSRAWYTENGIDTFCEDIQSSGSGFNITDVFSFVPLTKSEYWFTFSIGHGNSNNNCGEVKNFYIYQGNSNKANLTTVIVSEHNNPFNFETWKKGKINILRVSRSVAPLSTKMIFVIKIDDADTIDGDVKDLYIYIDPTYSSNSYGGYFVMCVDDVPYVQFAYGTSDEQTVTYRNANTNNKSITFDNRGYCSNYIIRPMIIMGVKTGLYSIDGGEKQIGNNTEFTLDGANWFHMGCGICVKL